MERVEHRRTYGGVTVYIHYVQFISVDAQGESESKLETTSRADHAKWVFLHLWSYLYLCLDVDLCFVNQINNFNAFK